MAIVTTEPDSSKTTRTWIPRRVLITPDALDSSYGNELQQRLSNLGLPVEVMSQNRLTGLRGATDRETYRLAKSTLAIVNAPPSQLRLQPIPPSADFQFHLAQGCPAHCHYCYLAGSLAGPPVIRVYANLPDILENLKNYVKPGRTTSFEASCYTDPVGLEHLTGGLARTISFFGQLPGAHLRFVTKFAAVDPLLKLDHKGHTRPRISLNAPEVARLLEGGVPDVATRIAALKRLALPRGQGGGEYPVGVVLAPIIPIDNWQDAYGRLLNALEPAIGFAQDLTFELITHRFTEGSREVLTGWYPNSSLQMTEEGRTRKHNKFGGSKYVFEPATMNALKAFFYSQIGAQFPKAKILYWT